MTAHRCLLSFTPGFKPGISGLTGFRVTVSTVYILGIQKPLKRLTNQGGLLVTRLKPGENEMKHMVPNLT